MFNKESSAELCPGKVANDKGRIWTGSCQREIARALLLFCHFH